MIILRDGTFTLSLEGNALSRGLRPSKRSPRNAQYLVKAAGMVGIDGVLQVIDDLELSRIDTSTITDGFPYPQLFVFTNFILVCGETDIYEWDGSTLNHAYGPVAAGHIWSAISFYDFIFMSNSSVVLVRDPLSGVWSESSDYPLFEAVEDFNGQIMIGGLL